MFLQSTFCIQLYRALQKMLLKTKIVRRKNREKIDLFS